MLNADSAISHYCNSWPCRGKTVWLGSMTKITKVMEGEKRTRKPNWTEEQCLLLAQLVEENKGVLRGKFGSGITAQAKRQTWERIARRISASFPLLLRTSNECEKRWYVLQSKARAAVAAQKRASSQSGESWRLPERLWLQTSLTWLWCDSILCARLLDCL